VLAHEAAYQLGLERVHLVTTGRPPHKAIPNDPGSTVRHEMAVRAARSGAGGLLFADPLEVDAASRSDEPTYTVDTLRLLAREEDELVLIMGADAAASLESWRAPGEILELARISVAARPGAMLDEAEAALARLGRRDRMHAVAMPEIGVSSTDVRRRAAEGGPIGHLVPQGVAELIEARGLYRPAVRT